MIVFVGYPADASVILKQTGELGLKKKWIAAEGIADPVMFKNPEVARQMEGMLLTMNLHKQTFGKDYGIYSDTEYDAVMLAYTIAAAGNDGKAIREALPASQKLTKQRPVIRPLTRTAMSEAATEFWKSRITQ